MDPGCLCIKINSLVRYKFTKKREVKSARDVKNNVRKYNMRINIIMGSG